LRKPTDTFNKQKSVSWRRYEAGKSKLGVRLLKVKVKFTLEQATKAQRWRRGIALLFL